MGRAVVSTAIGCEGLEVAAGEDIIIAEDSGEMAAVIVDLLKDREKARRIGLNAVETVMAILVNSDRRSCAIRPPFLRYPA